MTKEPKPTLMEKISEYGGFGFVLFSAVIAASVSYGSSQATAQSTLNNHETRLVILEQESKENAKIVSRMEQKVDDIWKDNGHKD